MRKKSIYLSIFFLIFLTAGLSSCKQYTANLEEFLSYWSSEAAVVKAEIKTAHIADKDGYASVASDKDAEIILSVRNPKQYQFLLPAASERRSAFGFASGVRSVAGSGAPEPDKDYTVSQLDGSTLKLVYKKEFLQANEHGAYNLNPEIVLWSKEGRRFQESFTFNIRANTPPPALADAVVGQTVGTEPYYVLCIQLPQQAMEVSFSAGGGGTLLHGDITALLINGRAYGVSVDGSGIKKPGEADFISRDQVAQLSVPGAEAIPGGKWVVFYKTDVPVADGAPVKNYKVQVADRMGLKSREYSASTKPNKPAAVQVRQTAGSSSAADLSAANDADSPHELIVSGGGDAALQLSCGRPEQAVVRCTVKALPDGDTEHYAGNTISIPLSAGSGSKDYQLTFFADAEGFTPLAPKTVYYRVKRLTEPELIALSAENAVHGTYPFNQAFTGAVKDYTVTVPYGGSTASVTLNAAAVAGCELREIDIDGTVTLLDPAVQAKSETVTLGTTETDSRIIKITVRLASDHTKTAVYTVQVRYGPTLSGLTVEHGTPLAFRDSDDTTDVLFSAGTLEYYVFVPDISPATVAVSATAGAGAQTASITAVAAAGTTVTVTENSVPLPIAGGTITVTVPVTKDGQETRYTVHIKRKAYEFTVKGEPAGLGTVHITEGGGVSVVSGNDTAQCRVRAEVGALVPLKARAAADACFEKWSTGQKNNPINIPVNTSGNDISAHFISTVIDTTIAAEKRWKHLKDAVAAIPDGGTIIIDGEIKATNASDNNGEIVINKNLTIKGKTGRDNDILDANSNYAAGTAPADAPASPHRIFKVEAGKKLTLKNLTLQNGWAKGAASEDKCGGAIYTKKGTIELHTVTVKSNTAEQGGAVWVYGDDNSIRLLTAVNCIIEGNRLVRLYGHTLESGAGLYIAETQGLITDTQMIKNEVRSGEGSALSGINAHIVIEGDSVIGGSAENANRGRDGSINIFGGELTLKNSVKITHNSVNGKGGGLHIRGAIASTTVTIQDDVEISNNKAVNGGGGISITGGTLTIKDRVKICNNEVSFDSGGGICADYSVLTYNHKNTNVAISGDVEIKGNTATENGGGICFNIKDPTKGALTVSDSVNIIDNSAGKGGGVYLFGTFNFTGGIIRGNTSQNEGSGIYLFRNRNPSFKNTSLNMSGSVKIDSANEIYLGSGTQIVIREALTPQDGTAGRITPETYPTGGNDVQVLDGDITTGTPQNYTKFTVTPQDLGGGNKQHWTIDDEGKLRKDFVEVSFTNLGSYLQNTASATEVNHIKVIGLTKENLKGTSVGGSPSPSGLGQILKDKDTKKVSLILPETVADLTDMSNCFRGCTSLIEVSGIPEGVEKMNACFTGCSNLTKVPALPKSVKNMTSCFYGCTSLNEAPDIPENVEFLESCFRDCKKLNQAPVIRTTKVNKMKSCFSGCEKLTVAPVIPVSVEDMSYCFYGCKALAIGPDIPENVTNMQNCFTNCTNLSQVSDIPENVTIMHGCFEGCTSMRSVKLKCNYDSGTFSYGGTSTLKFKDAFKDCTGLESGGIRVPQGQLTNYQTNAGTMGTTAEKFASQ